jgi:hypothetical protein
VSVIEDFLDHYNREVDFFAEVARAVHLKVGLCTRISRSSWAKAHIDFIGGLRGAEAPLFHDTLSG